MDADQPGLFEVPVREAQAPPGRLQRGRNREVWTLSATAEVAITDASALRQAAARGIYLEERDGASPQARIVGSDPELGRALQARDYPAAHATTLTT